MVYNATRRNRRLKANRARVFHGQFPVLLDPPPNIIDTEQLILTHKMQGYDPVNEPDKIDFQGFIIDRELLNKRQVQLLKLYLSFAEKAKDSTINLGTKNTARLMRCSVSTVERARIKLCDYGYITANYNSKIRKHEITILFPQK